MGSNISTNEIHKFLNNHENWSLIRTKKHEIWAFYDDTKQTKKVGQITLNTHITKGQGISEKALKNIAKIMKIDKQELNRIVKKC